MANDDDLTNGRSITGNSFVALHQLSFQLRNAAEVKSFADRVHRPTLIWLM